MVYIMITVTLFILSGSLILTVFCVLERIVTGSTVHLKGRFCEFSHVLLFLGKISQNLGFSHFCSFVTQVTNKKKSLKIRIVCFGNGVKF